jgi:hypothetical protein
MDSDVQLLVNTVMSWAEAELKMHGGIPALAAWLPTVEDDLRDPEVRTQARPQVRSAERPHETVQETIQAQEAGLAEDLKARWRDGEVSVAALVAPVLFGKAGTAERSEAVRLHIEARSGYCADILMPYRVRPPFGRRRDRQNRVHFRHPVAQESLPRLGEPSAQTPMLGIDHADET